jgi:hypothetical protein
MKMVKRTLIAIAVVALLATSAHAALKEYYFGPYGDDYAVKVDGNEKIRWPYEYKALTVCTIPIKMSVGMYVQVEDCKKKKIILGQVDCADINKNADNYPCYLGCTDFNVRANFDALMGGNINKLKIGDEEEQVLQDVDWYYEDEDGIDKWSLVPGDGSWHNVKVCVTAWKFQIWNAPPGDEVDVGTLDITVKPNL